MGTMKEFCEVMFDVGAEIDEVLQGWETVRVLCEDLYCEVSNSACNNSGTLCPATVDMLERKTLQLNALLMLIEKYDYSIAQ